MPAKYLYTYNSRNKTSQSVSILNEFPDAGDLLTKTKPDLLPTKERYRCIVQYYLERYRCIVQYYLACSTRGDDTTVSISIELKTISNNNMRNRHRTQ